MKLKNSVQPDLTLTAVGDSISGGQAERDGDGAEKLNIEFGEGKYKFGLA
jgi:hypothetical protein